MKDSIRYVNIKEFASYFGIPRRTVTTACRNGKIPGAIQPLGPNTQWRIPLKVGGKA